MAFSERLKEVMERKKMSCRDVAIALYNGNSDSDLWDKYADYKEKRSLIRKIEKWRTGTVPKNIDDIEKLCKVFDCDISYFFNEEPLQNLNNKKVADFLGLDEETVSHIKNYTEYEKSFLSCLTRAEEVHKGYGDILQEILHILGLHADSSSHTTITIETLDSKEVLKGGDTLDYILDASKNMLESVLLKITDIGIKVNRIKYEKKMESERKEREAEMDALVKECIELVGEEEFYKNFPNRKK